MDRKQLAATLQREGIRADAYTLDGRHANETYVLHREGDSWILYYSERGLRTGLRSFELEADACTHLLTLLRSDDSTRA
jgi:hypothetical protein